MSDEFPYFDSSALAKLILRNEPGADLAIQLWRGAKETYASRLAYPETYSAIVRAQRDSRLPADDLDPALEQFERYWQTVLIVELTPEIARQAREIVRRYALSGADAVHVASAFAAGADADITFVTWDQRQATAAMNSGLAVTPAPD